ncbi:DUF1294 domain-containing protein [Escherichia coli]|nr:DUF1294 domain-containing protein [Escherichia coli]
MNTETWALALLGVNLWSLVLFAWDKLQARQRGWRVSEATFLTLAACGGWPALKLGQRMIRHKTRKQPFGWMLNSMIGVNLFLALMLWLLVTFGGGLPVPDLNPSAPDRGTTPRFFKSVGG